MKFVILGILALVVAFVYYKSVESKKISAANMEIGQQFLLDNKAQAQITETPSGLQYEVLVKGNGTVNPTASDTVRVHYHGTLLDGTVFDSSVDRGTPISFALRQVIAGWIEGVQLMTVGDKFRFYIPAELAYGRNAAGKIPPGSTLIFDIELLAVE